MRVGVYLDMRNPPVNDRPWHRHYGVWLDRIADLDEVGADAVWLTEHHFFDDGYLPQCWTFAAAIAARTERMRIGTAVALLPLHSSMEVAEQIALVDIISGGRTEPGFGVGYRKPEYEAFHGDYKRRYSVFAERITELRQLWGEAPGAARTITPRPLQSPVPMWAGFGGPLGARIAGRLGLGLQSTDRDLVPVYLGALEEAGQPMAAGRLAAQYEFLVARDPERTRALVGDRIAYRWESYNRHMFEGTSREADAPDFFDAEARREGFVVGTPDQIADQITRDIEGLPVSDVYVWGDFAGVADTIIEEHLELTFTKVAPLLKGR